MYNNGKMKIISINESNKASDKIDREGRYDNINIIIASAIKIETVTKARIKVGLLNNFEYDLEIIAFSTVCISNSTSVFITFH
jgi:hypothetical protein